MSVERISDAALAQAFRDWAERLIHKTPSICTEAVEYGDMVREYVYSRARELDALEQREAATPPRDVPEGFVLVPRVPTAEMIEAMRHDDNWPSLLTGEAQRIYAAALTAAPPGDAA